MKYGADANVRDNWNKTLLHIASFGGILIDAYVQLNRTERNVIWYHLENEKTVELLIRNGLDVNANDGKNVTPLTDAVLSGI